MPANTLTLIGTVATEVTQSMDDTGLAARFGLLLKSRRFDRDNNSWTISDKTRLSVVCRRRLASNVVARLQRGDPVLVTGALRTRRSTRTSRFELEAYNVGLDLSRMIFESQADGAA